MSISTNEEGFPHRRMPPSGPSIRDVDYNQLDQNKVAVYGVGLFTGITTALFPLSVIKTRQMASPTTTPGFSGAMQTAAKIYSSDGFRGFYRGFGTVVAGAIPARILFLPTYEASRTWARDELNQSFGGVVPETAIAAISNGFGGACGSLASSAVVVPMDVVSSRLMVLKRSTVSTAAAATDAAACSTGGGSLLPSRSPSGSASAVPRAHGTAGSCIQRGSGSAAVQMAAHASQSSRNIHNLAVGSSAVLKPLACSRAAVPSATQIAGGAPQEVCRRAWSLALQARSLHVDSAGVARPLAMNGLSMAQLILKQEGVRGLYRGLGMSLITYTPSSAAWWSAYAWYQACAWHFLYVQGYDIQDHDRAAIAAVQAGSGCLAGLTSGALTTPLDVIKTQIQVAGRCPTTARLTTLELAGRLYKREGLAGFWRGSIPRMLNVALWGTCMVSAYEFLKRACTKDDAGLLQ